MLGNRSIICRYLLPQRTRLLPPLDHTTQQAAEDIRERRYHLLHQVRLIPADTFTRFQFIPLDTTYILGSLSWKLNRMLILKYLHQCKILMESIQPIPTLIFKFFTSLILCLNSSSSANFIEWREGSPYLVLEM